MIVLANGVFDLLHAGHVAHLREAKEMGDYLIVALTIDEFVGKGNGRPVYDWDQRAALLRELRCVDYVTPTRNSVEAILHEEPDIFVKGPDYLGERFSEDIKGACRMIGTQIRYTSSPKQSTTETIKRIWALRQH